MDNKHIHKPVNEYRPRSPNLPPLPSFPPGYSLSPRGSYDASPYFSPQTSQAPAYFGNQPTMSVPSLQQQPAPTMVEVRTKFPVARIKRIMQADEDVGKVAQATPTAVAKALEQFMVALVTKGAENAQAANSKRVSAVLLKEALLNDPQFDFLKDICENVPEEAVKKSKPNDESD